MNAEQVIQNIHNIYTQFYVPPFIQEHMIRAAGVGVLICKNWQGPDINHTNIEAALLIHDLANLVKSNLETAIGKKIMGKEAERLNYWLQIKKNIINKYDSDDHSAESKMLAELGIEKRLLFVLENMTIGHNNQNVMSDDWDIKICAYADQRIGPFGVVSLKDRYDDLIKRNNRHIGKPHIVENAFVIEQQIIKNTKLQSENISDESVREYINNILTRHV